MRALCLFAVALRSLAPAQHGADWPQFRAPNASGVAASDAAPPVEFGPRKRLIWKQPLPPGHSSPAVWGGRIFLTAFDPESKKLELICTSAKTGARRPQPRSKRRMWSAILPRLRLRWIASAFTSISLLMA
jgi:hypothetical protein